MTKEQVMEQKIERLRYKLMDVLNDQRKKDQKTGKTAMDSNVCLLSALVLVSADVIVSVSSREGIEGYRKAYDTELRDCINRILIKNSQ